MKAFRMTLAASEVTAIISRVNRYPHMLILFNDKIGCHESTLSVAFEISAILVLGIYKKKKYISSYRSKRKIVLLTNFHLPSVFNIEKTLLLSLTACMLCVMLS